jgi:hypothetical protein
MATSRAVAVLAIAALWACGPSSNQPKALVSSEGLAEAELIFGEHPHPMPLFGGPQPDIADIAHLNYYGGVVLSNVAAVVVFWGPNVNATTRSQIGGFYSAVTNSAYMDWLSEYNTTIPAQDGGPGTNQLIGRGTLASTVTITPSRTATTLQDTDIQAELNSQISAGFLPAPTANTVYMTYFPPGIRIIMGGSQSCAAGGFCAYHGTFRRSGSSTFYSVMPDMGPGSGCDLGCGNSTPFNNLTSVSSHELIETVTDADVGLATVIGRPLAWYDPVNGEIGDICNGNQGSIAGYVVQRQWSNVSAACIVSRTVSDDFSISLNPTTQSTPPGSTTSYTVNTAILSGAAQTINLSISGLPASITGSFNPPTISAGGSSTLTLTVSGGALPATYNFSVTGTGTSATHSTPGSVIVTGDTGGGLVNGDFETGDLTGWTPSGTALVVGIPHGGSFSAQVGSTSPSADSSITQTFNLPATATNLSFFYQVVCPDTVTYDWATATLQDNVTSTVVTLLPPTCTNSGLWVQVTTDVSAMAGHSVTLTLSNHDDGYATDPTYTLYDDVVVGTASASNPILNGGFETGDLSSWSLLGIGSPSTVPHSGTFSAQLGSTSPSAESSLSQTFTVPPTGGTLSLWYQVHCPDTITYDWATATLRDNVTASTITVLPPTCTNTGLWVQASANISAMAGHSATLTLINHDYDYFADPTYTLYDDVMVQ